MIPVIEAAGKGVSAALEAVRNELRNVKMGKEVQLAMYRVEWHLAQALESCRNAYVCGRGYVPLADRAAKAAKGGNENGKGE